MQLWHPPLQHQHGRLHLENQHGLNQITIKPQTCITQSPTSNAVRHTCIQILFMCKPNFHIHKTHQSIKDSKIETLRHLRHRHDLSLQVVHACGQHAKQNSRTNNSQHSKSKVWTDNGARKERRSSHLFFPLMFDLKLKQQFQLLQLQVQELLHSWHSPTTYYNALHVT